jgi:hypothetical protein
VRALRENLHAVQRPLQAQQKRRLHGILVKYRDF